MIQKLVWLLQNLYDARLLLYIFFCMLQTLNLTNHIFCFNVTLLFFFFLLICFLLLLCGFNILVSIFKVSLISSRSFHLVAFKYNHAFYFIFHPIVQYALKYFKLIKVSNNVFTSFTQHKNLWFFFRFTTWFTTWFTVHDFSWWKLGFA